MAEGGVVGQERIQAAGRVRTAIRGEAESAEALGLTMNDAATGLADVSAGMTDAEKAAFRYGRLLDQSTFATGAAAEQAQTASGAGDGGGGAVNFSRPVTLAPTSSDVAAAVRREALAGAPVKEAGQDRRRSRRPRHTIRGRPIMTAMPNTDPTTTAVAGTSHTSPPHRTDPGRG